MKIEGITFNSKLPQAMKQIEAETDRTTEDICNAAIGYAQRFGPYAPERMARRRTATAVPKMIRGKKNKGSLPPVTGNLGRSIKSTRVGKGMYQLATETGYGAYVELGTSRAPAYPYLRPAIARAIQEFKKKNG